MSGMHAMGAGGAALMMAMMLPAAIPAFLRRTHDGVGHAAAFTIGYLAAWCAFALAVSMLLPHGMLIALAVMAAACIYELFPIILRRQVR